MSATHTRLLWSTRRATNSCKGLFPLYTTSGCHLPRALTIILLQFSLTLVDHMVEDNLGGKMWSGKMQFLRTRAGSQAVSLGVTVRDLHGSEDGQ